MATIALVGLQLIPLPPAVWLALPGREVFAGSAGVIDGPQPWRPLSISPGGTRNALGSLVVPFTALFLASRLRPGNQWRLVTLLLGLVFAATVVGIIEFSGVNYDNPFLNDRLDEVNGSFANRNHFALFGAIGILLAPAWGLRGTPPAWRVLAVIGLLALFLLTVLATGSRSGAALALLAFAYGIFSIRGEQISLRRKVSRKVFWAAVVASVGIVIGAAAVSISTDRAISVERATELHAGSDLRLQTLPVVVRMVGKYFPAGTGFGTFDPAYRIDEPAALLGPQYLNAAHNDIVQVALEGGAPGIVLMLIAGVWFSRASIRAMKSRRSLPRLGSAIIGLTILASITDYPARTPMIMALLAVASVWLVAPDEPEPRATRGRRGALPNQEPPL